MHTHEFLARSQHSERVGPAYPLHRGHQLALVRRKSRRAQQAALQSRLTLARSL